MIKGREKRLGWDGVGWSGKRRKEREFAVGDWKNKPRKKEKHRMIKS